RKPECLRCAKSGNPCPGYRDLGDAMFRDESERIIRNVQQQQQQRSVGYTHDNHSPCTRSSSGWDSDSHFAPSLSPARGESIPVVLSNTLSQPPHELAPSFFFSKYTFNIHPFFSNYNDWLSETYRLEGVGRAHQRPGLLQAAINAVGMAGLSNLYHSPNFAKDSRQQYCIALYCLKEALRDPDKAVADITLVTVILLGLFETVSFESWNRYHHCAAHVKGATVLLDLRGPEQFIRERGGLLYSMARSQII
ncbi:hypothetical protein B0H66DRAFT_452117, partial [Apodospora peruviana]